MNLVNRLGLWAGIVALAATGCSQSPMTVRGQAPDFNDGPLIGSAPGYGDLKKHPKKHQDYKLLGNHWNNKFGNESGFYSTKEDYYANHQKYVYDVEDGGGMGGMGCPACDGGMSCPDGGCPHCGYGCHHKPKHYYTYQYDWPKNLVYPPPVLPAGMVQYPYYTLRGPTDFFMK